MTRPVISEYKDLAQYIRDMIQYRKTHEKHFSVLRVAKNLRRCSPALISLIVQGKRKLTLDRLDDIAELLNLSSSEKRYLHGCLQDKEAKGTGNSVLTDHKVGHRKQISSHILSDWMNVYVKDAFSLQSVQADWQNIYSILSAVATRKRIDKSIHFLLKNGYLRRDANGKIVEDSPLTVTDPRVADSKIKQFHKQALRIAITAIDDYSTEDRLANALILPLNQQNYQELRRLLDDFAAQLQDFAERQRQPGDRLYQCLINLSPTGGIPRE